MLARNVRIYFQTASSLVFFIIKMIIQYTFKYMYILSLFHNSDDQLLCKKSFEY